MNSSKTILRLPKLLTQLRHRSEGQGLTYMGRSVTLRSLVLENVPLKDALYRALVAIRVKHHFRFFLYFLTVTLDRLSK